MRQSENFQLRIGMAGPPPPPNPPSLPPTQVGGATLPPAPFYPHRTRHKHYMKTTIDYSFKRDRDLRCLRRLWTALSCSLLKTYRHIVQRPFLLKHQYISNLSSILRALSYISCN